MIYDLLFIFIIVASALMGLLKGAIKEGAGLLSLFLAFILMSPLGKFLRPVVEKTVPLPLLFVPYASMTLAVILILLSVSLLAWFLQKKIIRQKGTGLSCQANRWGGFLLGGIKGTLLILLILWVGHPLLNIARLSMARSSPVRAEGIGRILRHLQTGLKSSFVAQATRGMSPQELSFLHRLPELLSNQDFISGIAHEPEIKKILNHRKVRDVLNDKEIAETALHRDFRKLLNNRKIQELLNDREILNALEEIDYEKYLKTPK